MVIFDEFSGISLMDRDRRIDRGRFPNLAALADDGVWVPQRNQSSPARRSRRFRPC